MRRLQRIHYLFLSLFFSHFATAGTLVTEHCLSGCPVSENDSLTTIVRPIYTLANNADTKFADWVAYHVTQETIGKSKNRKWRIDPELDGNETLNPNDYKFANASIKTDRGHQVPLASFSGTSYWFQTNFLSNITPQKSTLNQGAWARLEDVVRSVAIRSESGIYVITGPIYDTKWTLKLPNTSKEHSIPSAYWKILAIPNGDEVEVLSFVMVQDLARNSKYCDQLVKISEIESMAKLNVFPKAMQVQESSWLKSNVGCQ